MAGRDQWEQDLSTAPMLAKQFESLFDGESLVIADITATTDAGSPRVSGSIHARV